MISKPGRSFCGLQFTPGIPMECFASPFWQKRLFLSQWSGFLFSCLYDRATVRSGAEIGLLSLRLNVSQGASLGDFLLAPACPIEKVTHWGEIEPLSATLAQDGLAECDQPGKNPLKYSSMAGNWTRATGRTDSELSHWAIMTDRWRSNWSRATLYRQKCNSLQACLDKLMLP